MTPCFVDNFNTKGKFAGMLNKRIIEALCECIDRLERNQTKFTLEQPAYTVFRKPECFDRHLYMPDKVCNLNVLGKVLQYEDRDGRGTKSSVYRVEELLNNCHKVQDFCVKKLHLLMDWKFDPDVSFTTAQSRSNVERLWEDSDTHNKILTGDYLHTILAIVTCTLGKLYRVVDSDAQRRFVYMNLPFTALSKEMREFLNNEPLGIYESKRCNMWAIHEKFNDFPKSISRDKVIQIGAGWLHRYAEFHCLKEPYPELISEALDQIDNARNDRRTVTAQAAIVNLNTSVSDGYVASYDGKVHVANTGQWLSRHVYEEMGTNSKVPSRGSRNFNLRSQQYWITAAVIAGVYFSFRKF